MDINRAARDWVRTRSTSRAVTVSTASSIVSSISCAADADSRRAVAA
jgi:hypothetical protein